jgi:hypothetical protein
MVPNPTMEVVSAAVVLQGAATGRPEDGARLLAFLTGAQGQEILRGAGYQRASGQGGGPEGPQVRLLPLPSAGEREELLRQWQRTGE